MSDHSDNSVHSAASIWSHLAHSPEWAIWTPSPSPLPSPFQSPYNSPVHPPPNPQYMPYYIPNPPAPGAPAHNSDTESGGSTPPPLVNDVPEGHQPQMVQWDEADLPHDTPGLANIARVEGVQGSALMCAVCGKRPRKPCYEPNTRWECGSYICDPCQQVFRKAVREAREHSLRWCAGIWTNVCQQQPRNSKGCNGHRLRRLLALGANPRLVRWPDPVTGVVARGGH